MKLPLLATSAGKQQGSPSVCAIANYFRSTAISSKETCSDQVQFASSLLSGKSNQKLNEIDLMEATIDKILFFRMQDVFSVEKIPVFQS